MTDSITVNCICGGNENFNGKSSEYCTVLLIRVHNSPDHWTAQARTKNATKYDCMTFLLTLNNHSFKGSSNFMWAVHPVALF